MSARLGKAVGQTVAMHGVAFAASLALREAVKTLQINDCAPLFAWGVGYCYCLPKKTQA
jgi:hypothetical protein